MDTENKLQIHSPLNSGTKEIRILTLHAGKRDSPIRCSLTTVSLDRRPKYNALSYEWGSPDSQMHDIEVDGRPFSVRDNLFWALNCLRKGKKDMVLWIDAICIDQDNVKERNHQVDMMGDVYRTAKCVRVWLGRGNADSEKSLKPLDKTVLFYRLTDKLPSSLELMCWQLVQRWTRAINQIRPNSCMDPNSIFDRLESSYWNRVWIIQEVVLARKLIIHRDEDSVKWHDFSIRFIGRWGAMDFTVVSPKGVFFLRDGYRRRESKTLPFMLNYTKRSGATDTRDRIFALLSLVNEDERQAIPVDYDLTLQELHERIAIHYHGIALFNDWKKEGYRSWQRSDIEDDKFLAFHFFNELGIVLGIPDAQLP